MSKDIDPKEMVLEPYDNIRSSLKIGDLMFASGNYLVSRAIKFATNSWWSHVGIVVPIPEIDRVLILESVEDQGVRLAPLSKYVSHYSGNKPYDGAVVLARHTQFEDKKPHQLMQFGADELTKPYDKDEIGKIIARIALGEGKKKRDKEYICSEIVYECFSRAGISFNYNKRGFISPADIWNDPNISVIARIL